MNVNVSAIFRFRKDKVEEGLKVVEDLIKATRQEEGCIEYFLVKDMDTEGQFCMKEKWESIDHLEKHLKTQHFNNFIEKTTPYTEFSAIYKGYQLF